MRDLLTMFMGTEGCCLYYTLFFSENNFVTNPLSHKKDFILNPIRLLISVERLVNSDRFSRARTEI